MIDRSSSALVCGGGRGIGRAIACQLAANGVRVAIAARTLSELEEAQEVIISGGGECHVISADLSDPIGASEAVLAASRHLDGLDVLINAAGWHPTTALIEEYPIDYWQEMLGANLSLVFYTCRSVIPIMKVRKYGRIINIASVAAQKGFARAAGYVAAKHGLLGLTKVLALELGTFGITANAVCPGFVDTRMTSGKQELRDYAVSHAALQRVVEIEDLASLVVFLAGPSSGSITGQAINVCAGLLI